MIVFCCHLTQICFQFLGMEVILAYFQMKPLLHFEASSRVWVQNNLLFVVFPFVAGLLSNISWSWEEKPLKSVNTHMYVQRQKCRHCHWKQKLWWNGLNLNILHHTCRLWKSQFGYQEEYVETNKSLERVKYILLLMQCSDSFQLSWVVCHLAESACL